jgi:flagellar biosynthetic protein FlhB
MVADESFDEKTEPATARQIERARSEGRVLRSQDLTSAAMLAAAVVVLVMWVPFFLDALGSLTWTLHRHADSFDLTSDGLPGLAWLAAGWGFKVLAPICLPLAAVALLANLLQVGPLLSPKALALKLEHLDPIKGAKRLVSIRGFVELVKSLVKVVLVALVALVTIQSEQAELMALDQMSVREASSILGGVSMHLLINVAAAFAGIAVLDYLFQRWHYLRGLRMSKREVQDEMKQSDGDPFVRGRVRGLMRELSRRRMLDDVATATVVITNPIHVAVALRYQAGRDDAPIVVAKGMRKIAARIRERAGEHDVPIVENPPLARQLNRSVRVGGHVPTALYRAVAEVLAFVYQVRNPARRSGGGTKVGAGVSDVR